MIFRRENQKKTRWRSQVCAVCSVFFLLASFGQVRGYNCETLEQASAVLEEHSLFVVERSSQQVWQGFVDRLDVHKLYLTEGQRLELLEEVLDLDLLPSSLVCQHIERLGSEVVQKARIFHKAYPKLLQKLIHKDYRLAGHPTMTIPFSRAKRAKNDMELRERWKKFFVYKRFTQEELSNKDFKKHLVDLFAELDKKISLVSYWYMAFFEAYYKSVDPSSRVFGFEDKVGEPRRYLFQDLRKESMEYLNYISRIIGGSWVVENYFQYNTKLSYFRPRKVAADFSSFYDARRGDYVVNLWDEEKESYPNRMILLRRERQGFRWDHYSDTYPNMVSSYRHSVLHHFYFPKTVDLDLDEHLNIEESSIKKSDFSYIDLQDPPKRKDHHPVPTDYSSSSMVMFMSLRYFMGGSNQNRNTDYFFKVISEIVEKFQKYVVDQGYAHHGVVLDLRNSSSFFTLPRYLDVLDVFMDRRPGVIVRSRRDVKVYGGKRFKRNFSPYRGPLVLLVDQDTRGYSEVMAAAFQESGRALVLGAGLGKTTSGRFFGSFNRKYRASHPPITMNYRLASFLLYTPSGKSFMGEGMRPDISLPLERDVFDQDFFLQDRKLRSLPDLPESLMVQDCSVLLAPTLISLLKKRSDERLLSEKHLRWQGKDDVKELPGYLSFEEAFDLSSQQLRDEEVMASCEPQCSEISLSYHDFKEDRRISLLRNKFYQKNLKPFPNYYLKAAMEDATLKEALNIAADYSYFSTFPPPEDGFR